MYRLLKKAIEEPRADVDTLIEEASKMFPNVNFEDPVKRLSPPAGILDDGSVVSWFKTATGVLAMVDLRYFILRMESGTQVPEEEIEKYNVSSFSPLSDLGIHTYR